MKRVFKTSVENAERAASKISFHRGLIPVAVRNRRGKILMLAFMNREALVKTLNSGLMHYYSRSRRGIWMKGETSGFVQKVLEVRVNCENNSLLFTVDQEGPGACHMGFETCFYRVVDEKGLFKKVEKRVFDPGRVYGRR
ncbi:MAG: phosphoribosyl-AMP cyclohydrolase [Thermoproteota archaeon]